MVVGVLAALLLAVFAFVMTSNQVNDRTSEIATAEAQAVRAEGRAAAFGPFQQFAQIKAARLASVKTLADTRFDWERMMRELAHVLPAGSSLTSVTASSGDGASATSTPGAPPAPAPAPAPAAPAPPPAGGTAAPPAAAGAATTTSGAGTPTLTLTGCATSQRRVAVMLVRLRQLHRALDVQLVDSSQAEPSAAQTAPATGNTGCFGSDYLFNVSVTFDSAPSAELEGEDRAVPSRLGGGA